MRTILSESKKSEKSPSRVARWVARFGVFGFLFFLVKGLAWILVPAAIAAYAAN